MKIWHGGGTNEIQLWRMENNRGSETRVIRGSKLILRSLIEITFELIKGEKYAVVNDFIRRKRGVGKRGFRQPLRRRIGRFNRWVFSRFSPSKRKKKKQKKNKKAKINGLCARSCNANLHRDAFFKKIAISNSVEYSFSKDFR